MCSRKYVLERDEVPWAREEDHTDNIAQGVITRFTGGPNADKDKWRQQHIDQNKVALSGLRKDVLKDKELLDLASGELMAQQKAFNVFLNDQGAAGGLNQGLSECRASAAGCGESHCQE